MRKLKGLLMTVLVLASMLTAVSWVPSAKAVDIPIHIHLTWQNDTDTTMTVTWQTSTSTAGDTVLYDTVSRDGVPASYSCSASGVNYTYIGASGIIHDVELTGLTPGTTYYFICGGPTGGYSGERSFRTAPSTSSDVRFVAGGDSRTNDAERNKISQAMAKLNPEFVMLGGDIVDSGYAQSYWDSWFMHMHNYWIGENNLTIPIMPVLGNHEDYDFKYFTQFALPGNEKWYSYDWGPDIHIVNLCSEGPGGEASEADVLAQKAWLESDLAAHADYMWKFVQFHRPVFVSGRHGPWTLARTHWVPLFDKYHVDIVFCGHDHNYQRSKPLNWTASQTTPQDYSNGTMYIVTGGWAAGLYEVVPIWYMAYQNSIYHFCVVDVFKNGTLRLQAKDDLGNTFDQVTISKIPPIRVPDDFPTIQAAINAPNPGVPIRVAPRTYNEHVVVNKSILLIGEDKETTIINGSGTGTVVNVTADDVDIRGFTIQNGQQGIDLTNSSGCQVSGNKLINHSICGITGGGTGSKDNSITYNTISSSSGSDGIRLQHANGTLIKGNIIANISDWAIKIEESSDITIEENNISNTLGIELYQSHDNVMRGNVISNSSGVDAIVLNSSSLNLIEENMENGGEIRLFQSHDNVVRGNVISNSSGDAIALNSSNRNVIEENTLTDNGGGLYVYGENNTIYQNNIVGNVYGVSIGKPNNTIYHNNLISNSYQVRLIEGSSEENRWDNGYPSGGNYWSDYEGNDTYSGPYQNEMGSDEIGDTPYIVDENNTDNYPLMGSWSRLQEEIATSVNLSAAWAYPLWTKPIIINVTVKNTGEFNKTFDVTVCYGGSATPIGSQKVASLPGSENRTLTFSWNIRGIEPCVFNYSTHSYVPYTISVNVSSPILGEISVIDGNVTVRRLGDATNDGHCDGFDFTMLNVAWLLQSGNPYFRPEADFNDDGIIDGFDFTSINVNWLLY